MSAYMNAVQSPAMARRESPTSDQVNLRIPKPVKAKLRRYTDRPLGPTMTAILLTALDEWFARNPLPPDKDDANVKGGGGRKQP